MNTIDSLEPDKYSINAGFCMSHYEASIKNNPIYYGFSWRPIKIIDKSKKMKQDKILPNTLL